MGLKSKIELRKNGLRTDECQFTCTELAAMNVIDHIKGLLGSPTLSADVARFLSNELASLTAKADRLAMANRQTADLQTCTAWSID